MGSARSDLGSLEDEQVVLVTEKAIVEVASQSAPGPAQGVEHPVRRLGKVRGDRHPILPVAQGGAQNSGILVMSPVKFHSR